MTTPFLAIAAVMVLVALACVLVPMLRSAHREGRPRAPFVLALIIALATPPAVFAGYLAIGTPAALNPTPANDDRATLAQAAQQLQTKLAQKPDDSKGWALLAQAYSALGEPAQALGALDHYLKLKPNDPDAMVAWVAAKAQTDPSHRIDAGSRLKLKHALELDPTQQRALWLLGISDFQRQDYANAATRWETLLPLLPPGSSVAKTVQSELADARARAGASPQGSGRAPSAATRPATGNIALNVVVKLDPDLKSRVKPGDTLFVFARAVNGPPAPVAVARLKASALPATVTLTNAMAMTPAMTLSKFAKVNIAARISPSGDAMPQPGDMESAPVEVATDSHAPVALTIDKVN